MELLAIWLAETAVLLVALNLAAMAVLGLLEPDSQLAADEAGESNRGSYRFRLPNYTDKARAEQHYRELDELEFTYRPYVAWAALPFAGRTITIDDQGERNPAAETAAWGPGEVVRLFGGSTVWGVGVDDDGTIAAELARLWPQAKVRNHGQFSYVSRQSLARLTSLITAGKKIGSAVFYDGVNEVAVLCRADTGVVGHNRQHQMSKRIRGYPKLEQRLQERRSAFLAGLWAVFLGHSVELLERLGGVSIAPAWAALPENHWVCDEQPDKARRVAESLLRNWQTAHQLVTAHGGRFRAVLQPVAYVGRPRVDHITEELDYFGAELRAQYAAVYPLVARMISDSGHDWMRLATHLYDGDDRLYIDFSHVTAAGNKIAAAFLYDVLNGK
ncbi:MAG: hypothetical protein CMM08_17285 [Rhodospirillaceae bacterium]|nr:hypothetical protein [Rhodospirillaceae bacterium]